MQVQSPRGRRVSSKDDSAISPGRPTARLRRGHCLLCRRCGRRPSDYWHTAGRRLFSKPVCKATADKLTVKTIFHCSDNPATAAVLFFDEWSSADGTEFKNDIVLIFDFDGDDRVRNLTVVFDTFPVRGKL
jgi:hypothetical protein